MSNRQESEVEVDTSRSFDNENLEISLLLDAIYRKYGYDFRSYAKASMKRRILHHLALSGLNSITEITHRVIYDPSYFESLLLEFSINVTEMFRDPPFFLALRTLSAQELSALPYLKIWHAGCSTGEEVYSMAIVLKETGLYGQSRIYATDFNNVVLKKAQEGLYPLGRIKEFTANYLNSGGTESFSDYYTAKYDSVAISQQLKTNVLFSHHNLVTDGVFGEMNIIVCRNVLIYFNKELQERIFRLFWDSLVPGGLLCLGHKESIRFSQYSGYFEDVNRELKIYRKKAAPLNEEDKAQPAPASGQKEKAPLPSHEEPFKEENFMEKETALLAEAMDRLGSLENLLQKRQKKRLAQE